MSSQELRRLSEESHKLKQDLLRSSSKDEALDTAIRAAETSMRALELAEDPKEKTRYSTRFKQLLEEAERIKTSSDWKSVVSYAQLTQHTSHSTVNIRARALKEPRSTRKLPNSEHIILLQAGFLNGAKYPPWESAPSSSEFILNDGEKLFLYVTWLRIFLHTTNLAHPQEI